MRRLRLPPIPLPELRPRLSGWLPSLPPGAALEMAAGPGGVRIRAAGIPEGAAEAFAALFRHAARWEDGEDPPPPRRAWAWRAETLFPAVRAGGADPFLTWAGLLREMARTSGGEIALAVCLLGEDRALQERLRALSAYAYGSKGGVDEEAPNPWALRLGLSRALIGMGILAAGGMGGGLAAGWLPLPEALAGMTAGTLLFLVGAELERRWLRLRSVPPEVLEARARGPLLRVAVLLRAWGDRPFPLPDPPLSGPGRWVEIPPKADPSPFALPLPAGEIAALLAPPETGEATGVLDPEAVAEIPAPPPSAALRAAPRIIGRAVATGEPVGVDPDAHGMIIGGSRTGKSSFAFALLRAILADPDPPGILLVDPHLALADAFLDAIDRLPPVRRATALRRLRVIDPQQEEVVPLNLLTLPDFAWAENALIQVGRRIWSEYWGPRMQAGLVGLFRIAHAWNRQAPEGRRMGLMHLVFLAHRPEWRREILPMLPVEVRMAAVGLDALLGQLAERYGSWQQGWMTEVISPILSKVMGMGLSPWLFRALHQQRFVDLEEWVREGAWIVVRPGTGVMGREAAALLSAVLYNVWEAVFRRTATAARPRPFLVVIDEAQEVAGGMALEQILSEGAKFGARVFVLAQGLGMLRALPEFAPAVRALLAASSTQAFFSPDPADADEIRSILSAHLRYGPHTMDLPSRQAWLRARVGGRWHPPTLIEVDPLPKADPERVRRILREAIEAHREDYVRPEAGMEAAWRLLEELLPPAMRAAAAVFEGRAVLPDEEDERLRRLGFEG